MIEMGKVNGWMAGWSVYHFNERMDTLVDLKWMNVWIDRLDTISKWMDGWIGYHFKAGQ